MGRAFFVLPAAFFLAEKACKMPNALFMLGYDSAKMNFKILSAKVFKLHFGQKPSWHKTICSYKKGINGLEI